MKKLSRCFLGIFLVFTLFFSTGNITSATTVITRTSDKLLGDFIGSAYNIFYNRDVDLDGFTYWYDMLSSGQSSVKTFIHKFVLESKEFADTVKIKEDFIERIYKFILGRAPDKDGMSYWLNYIDSKILQYYRGEYPDSYTNSEIITLRWNMNDSPRVINEVVNRMINSDEFAIRVSLMNVKLGKENVNIPMERTDAMSIYNSLENNISLNDYSNKEAEYEQIEKKLQYELQYKLQPNNLQTKILKYLGARVNNVAVSFYDLTTNESFDINGDVLFKAGSTHKVPLNIVFYDLVQAGIINLNTKVNYVHSKHFEAGSGILQNYIVNEMLEPQSFSELSRQSLLNSDNIAANMLITGINQYTSLYREYGKILGYPLNRIGNLFSANEMRTFLKKLYYNKDNNPYYKNIINNLKNSSRGIRIGRYIPESIVANKYGSYQGNYHDIGIVFGDRPFILCIYTKDVQNPEKIIADIAKIVYER